MRWRFPLHTSFRNVVRRVHQASAAALAGALAAACVTGAAAAQDTPELQSTEVAVAVDSGVRIAPAAGAGADAGQLNALYREIIRIDDAPWIRLQFGDVQLGGNIAADTGAMLRITSLHDGAAQWLDAVSIEQWRHTSAYFNGDAVLVELLAYPGTGASRVAVKAATVGLPTDDGGIASICFGDDDRELSFGMPDARALPVGCTAFLFNDRDHCLLTAGHCASFNNVLDPDRIQVVEFNPPLSNPNGSINFAPPEDQYPTDPSSFQFGRGNCSIDWSYFGAFANSNTGLAPAEAQGETYPIADAAPPVNGQTIRIRGYGTVSSPVSPTWNQVQKAHEGPYVIQDGTDIRYQTDTTGGNSGSAVFMVDTGEVIGIHTCGGCNSGGGANLGTAIHHDPLQAALANPLGICAEGLEPMEISVPSDFPTIQAAIDAATPDSVITVAPGTYNEAINFNGKRIVVQSSDGPADTVIDASGLNASVVSMTGVESPLTVLDGFTLTGGDGSLVNLGGTDYIFGGGLYLAGTSPTIMNCVIVDNLAQFGGGVFNNDADPTFDGCTFAGNASTASGGGMFNFSGASPQVLNCTFDANTASNGGAISNQSSSPTIAGTLFISNTATDNGGAVRNISGAAPVITDSIFTDNTAGASGGGVFNDESPDTTVGNSAFCSNAPDAIAGSYTDGGGNVFEESCEPVTPGDLDGDGVVDGTDLAILLGAWGACADCDDCDADLNGNCTVDGADLAILLGNWG
jgi:V8-like Glu-specific endopeptidase